MNMAFSLGDIAPLATGLLTLLTGAWILRGHFEKLQARIDALKATLDALEHRMVLLEKALEECDAGLKEAREGRSSIHAKADDAIGRIIRLETKLKMTHT